MKPCKIKEASQSPTFSVCQKPIEKYKTWQEASQAAIALGIKTQREYLERYKEDPRLPSNLNQTYKNFPGLRVFLGGKSIYKTWQEASRAAIALEIKTAYEYYKRYKEDSRLPSNPTRTYRDFPGFRIFLGSKSKKYKTWQEASKAAIALEIKTAYEYYKRYKEDSRLPSNPTRTYRDFPGFRIFLGSKSKKYKTWQEASKAAIALGIRTIREYYERYKEDSKLPSNPKRTYKNFPGFPVFLGTKSWIIYPDRNVQSIPVFSYTKMAHIGCVPKVKKENLERFEVVFWDNF